MKKDQTTKESGEKTEVDLFPDMIDGLISSLRFMKRCGYRGIECSPVTLEAMKGWTRVPTGRFESLEEIRDDLGECIRCLLHEKRTNIVFGEGNPEARLVFVGEGPGYDEDKQGRPFVGAAGQLLTRIIKAMNLTREEVYIANVIKCRPPMNRTPKPDEIDTCFPFLKRQLASINPEFICALGSVAVRALTGKDAYISMLRGRFFEYKGIQVMPTYHPAYLLRNPGKKREVWEDIQKLMKAMGI